MLIVHHLATSQSERIPWLCEELEIPYELVRYERDPGTRLAPREYKALHPLGMAPVIEDGNLRLAESGAIIEYLIHTYGGGRLAIAPGAPNYPDYLFWLHFANASFLPALVSHATAVRVRDEATQQRLSGRLNGSNNLIEQRMGSVPYLAGKAFTAADIIIFYSLTTLRRLLPRDMGPYPNTRAYVQRVGARPAYRQAMARMEPGMAPLLE